MSKEGTYSSPSRMVDELFTALRRLCIRTMESHESQDHMAVRQDAALCVILAVQCVEVFFNVYFRVAVSEAPYSHVAERICGDLQKTQYGLDRKIKEWPELVFGKKLNLGEGAGQNFVTLKSLRQRLMHFRSSHETISFPGITIQGMADMGFYEALSAQSAVDALETAEKFLCEVFLLRGIPEQNLPDALHAWTGRPLR